MTPWEPIVDKGSLSPHVYDMDPNTIVEGKQSDTKWRYISAICMYTLLQIDYKNAHVSVNLSDNKFDAPKLSSDVILGDTLHTAWILKNIKLIRTQVSGFYDNYTRCRKQRCRKQVSVHVVDPVYCLLQYCV